ncbi:MAG: hypothetical protein HGA47_09920, partial [Zoogloea sp.]|nr:hypothetical protein [Zoogloea sp.]
MKTRLTRHPDQRYIFTQREFDALYGLGPLAFALYCTLRTLMDFDSGEAGRRSGFAWNDLYTELETVTPKGKGFTRKKPSEQNMKTAVANLEKAGLIERRQGQYVVFFLPMALKGDVRSKQTQRIPNGTLPTEPNDQKPSNDAGFGGVSNGGSVRWVRPNPTHIRESGFTPSQSSSTEIAEARANDDAVHRDRPAASQAAPAGRGKH